jgi:arylsulfatase
LDPKTLTGADRPNPIAGKTDFTYDTNTPRLPNAVVPVLVGSHRITAQVEIPNSGAEGVLIAQGARYGGYTLYIKNGHLVYENNFYGRIREVITSSIPIPVGKADLVYEYTRENPAPWGGGTGRLFINGQLVGEGKLTRVGGPSYLGTFGVGRQYGSPVSPEYEVPFNFTGTLRKVVVQLTPAKPAVKTASADAR